MNIKYSIILISSLLLLNFSVTPQKIDKNDIKQATVVYVCGNSKVYHKSKEHSALKRCKSGIISMSEKKAESMGMRECKCKDK